MTTEVAVPSAEGPESTSRPRSCCALSAQRSSVASTRHEPGKAGRSVPPERKRLFIFLPPGE